MLLRQGNVHYWKSYAYVLTCFVYNAHYEIVKVFLISENYVCFYVLVFSVPEEERFSDASAPDVFNVLIIHQRIDFSVADYVLLKGVENFPHSDFWDSAEDFPVFCKYFRQLSPKRLSECLLCFRSLQLKLKDVSEFEVAVPFTSVQWKLVQYVEIFQSFLILDYGRVRERRFKRVILDFHVSIWDTPFFDVEKIYYLALFA